MQRLNFIKSMYSIMFGVLAIFLLNSCKKEKEQSQSIERQFAISKSVKIFDESKTYFVEVILQTDNEQRIQDFNANDPLLDIIDLKDLAAKLNQDQKNNTEINSEEIVFTKAQNENELQIIFTSNKNVPENLAYGLSFNKSNFQNNAKTAESCGPLWDVGLKSTLVNDLATVGYTKNASNCNAEFNYYSKGCCWYNNNGYRTLSNGGSHTFYASKYSSNKGVKMTALYYPGGGSSITWYAY